MYARQAITTKYIGPTNYRPARVKVTCDAHTATVAWDHALDTVENHARAARQVADLLGWTKYSNYHVGGTKDGYVFVAVEPDTRAFPRLE
jgi:hypothetical protein